MMNRVELVGRLVADVEMRTTQSGIAVASFRLAVQRNRKNPQGVYESDFLNITAWQHTAEFVQKYCAKGSMIAVAGRLQTRTYDAQDGTKRYITEVVADDITLCGNKQNTETQPQGSNGVTQEQQAAASRGDFSEVPNDDDFPF